MTLYLIQTEPLPLILPIQNLQVQIRVQMLTQALIQTKTDDHEMVTLVLIGLHVIWDQSQGGGSPFSKPPPQPSQTPTSPFPPLSTALPPAPAVASASASNSAWDAGGWAQNSTIRRGDRSPHPRCGNAKPEPKPLPLHLPQLLFSLTHLRPLTNARRKLLDADAPLSSGGESCLVYIAAADVHADGWVGRLTHDGQRAGFLRHMPQTRCKLTDPRFGSTATVQVRPPPPP